ncbi:hypothetical protein ACFU6M_02755 [Streptomyces bottropensis]|uniref:hypothetical protein n=1 Tax=Streptomyces bottropensis TaxID=42235 RepID=UPI003688158C
MHSARSAEARATIVDGHVVTRDREPLTVDVPATAAGLPALAALGAVGDERSRYHDEYEE